MIRNKILCQSNSLEQIMKGEVDPTDSINEFFKILYAGPCGDLLLPKKRLVSSTSPEVVYVCSSGKLLHGKGIFLKVTLKSMTGSKSVANLLSGFGHCISNKEKNDIGIFFSK